MSRSSWIINIYQRFFIKRRFYRLNKLIFNLSLRGLGILNFENDQLSGENYFLRHLMTGRNQFKNFVVLDVGANIGSYSNKIKKLSPSAEIYAFEPHPITYQRLRDEASKYGYRAFNLGCGSETGNLKLYDYKDNLEGTQHASIHKDVIEKIHCSASTEWDIQVTTLDSFLTEQKIAHVDLLKIDTEGHELSTLMGCRKSIEDQMIDIIQFEFNEMNIVSKVFFRDFYELLPNYSFYRMMPDGYLPINIYSPMFCEIFAYQNIIAIQQGCSLLGKI